MDFTAILPLLKSLGEALCKLFLGLFLIKTGVQKQQLADAEKEIKDGQEANQLKSRIKSKSDNDLRKLLSDERTTNDNDKKR